MDSKKIFIAVGIITWSGFVVAAYFVVQKPLALQVIDHLASFVWTLIITSLLVLNALALGTFTVRRFINDLVEDASTLALAGGIGLGELGLLGFVFVAVGATKLWILLVAQVLLFGWFLKQGMIRDVFFLIKRAGAEIRASSLLVPLWIRWAATLAFILTFLMTFLPPVDAFDALLYHLTVPERWLLDGGIRTYNLPHYWFPGLVEGVYFWGLGLASETVPQQVHFAWAICTMILVWHWTRRLWDDLTAWWALGLLISMPSLLLLAGWAYTDLALIFFGVAMLYTLSRGKEQSDNRWWMLGAISAGMAMGVKYTSFVMPLTAVILICIWKFRKRQLYIEVVKFALISTAVAALWYLRNWIWMGNPFYPFVFGGRFWDSFRAAWYASPGTGSGWDLKTLILLPLTVTLGYQDVNSIDADIGPLILLALPLAIWVIVNRTYVEEARKTTLTTIGFFSLFSAALWTYGYITTRNLWQTLLLLPAIVPFVIPAAVGITSIRSLDTKQLRLYFIVSTIAAISIYANLLDMGLSVLARNPLSVAAGIVTRQKYFERYQPGYAYALHLVSQTSSDSRIYSLFEPRSYGMNRILQPDPILDNFSHDIYLYGTPKNLVDEWRSQGYTHVLLNRRSATLILENTGQRAVFDQTIGLLNHILASPDDSYELFEIPARSLE